MKYLVILMLVVTSSLAKEPDYIIKRSHYSVNETIKRFKELAVENKFKIFAVIDHKEEARKVGLKMHEQKVVIFGGPRGGTRLMNSNPSMGLELPLKVAVYKDRGHVKLIYKNPAYYEKAFNLKKHPVLKNLKVILKEMTNKAIN